MPKDLDSRRRDWRSSLRDSGFIRGSCTSTALRLHRMNTGLRAVRPAGQVRYCRAMLFVVLTGPVLAQSLRVVSEFQRFDPFGDIVPVDHTAKPREILSPALARNAFASFHVIVTIPERDPFFLFVQTNPADVFQISLYEELFSKTAQGWIPDALQPS